MMDDSKTTECTEVPSGCDLEKVGEMRPLGNFNHNIVPPAQANALSTIVNTNGPLAGRRPGKRGVEIVQGVRTGCLGIVGYATLHKPNLCALNISRCANALSTSCHRSARAGNVLKAHKHGLRAKMRLNCRFVSFRQPLPRRPKEPFCVFRGNQFHSGTNHEEEGLCG